MAKQKTLNPDQLGNILGATHFAKDDDITSMSTDPVQPTGMVINLDQIESYDRNPRRADNDSYEELKKDLREDGSERVTITITRRPGAVKYMPDMGGNTRLSILKELYQETGDEKYYWLRVTFIPYKDEADVLIHHLIENDVRSDYIFIDRAMGVRDAYEQLCKDDDKEYSQREFVQQLKNRGYSSVSRTLLIRYNYAIDHLYAFIPSALDGGVGGLKVSNLKRLSSKYLDYWVAHGLDEQEFTAAWQQILSQNDSWDSFAPEMVEQDLLSYVTDRIRDTLSEYPALITPDTIKLEVDQYQKDPGLVSTLSKEPNYGWPTIDEADQSHTHTAPNKLDPFPPEESPEGLEDTGTPQAGVSDHMPSGSDDSNQTDLSTTPDKALQNLDTDIATLPQMQMQCYELSKKVAEYFEFSELIHRLDCGYGFYCEIPDAAFHPTDELKAYFWWQLFLVASVHNYSNYELLPETSNYRELANAAIKQNPLMDNDDVVRDVLGQIQSGIEELVPKPSSFTNTPLVFEQEYVSESIFSHYVQLLQLRRLICDLYGLDERWGL